MVLPLLPIGSIILVSGAYYKIKEGGFPSPVDPYIDDLEDFGNAIELTVSQFTELIGNIDNTLLSFVRGFGIAVLEGAQDTVNYMVDTAKPYRVPVAQTITSLAIWFAASMVIYRMVVKVN